MKTAISIPDRLFETAERTARQMGIPRSQLYVLALEEFLRHHGREAMMARLDSVYGMAAESSDGISDGAAVESLRELTKNDSW
jgi:N-acetylglutamate synthase-like GNAT family acetyltransferase